MAFFAAISTYFGPSTRVGGKIRVEQAAKKMAQRFANSKVDSISEFAKSEALLRTDT